MINESIKPSSKAIRVLKCIRDEQSWRASWETVEEITSMGWAIFFGLDDVEDPRDTRWELTDTGRDVLGG